MTFAAFCLTAAVAEAESVDSFDSRFKPANLRGKVVASIDLSEQRMNISVNGRRHYSFAVSTARRGYVTPTGSWRPTRLHKMWYSRKYNNSPMPHSVFFKGGYAVHGTDKISKLGRPASHGCIRLHPDNARTFYNLVKANGMRNTTVKIIR